MAKYDEWLTSPTADGNFSKDDKIPLQRGWSFWFLKPPVAGEEVDGGEGAAAPTPAATSVPLEKLCDFDTVQDFWACYNALPSPTVLGHKQAFHLMRSSVAPELEDPHHAKGGIWTFKVDRPGADDVWQTLLLAIIGEQFEMVLPKSDDICGVTAKGGPPSANQIIFQVWHKDEPSNDAVYNKLKALLPKSSELKSGYYRGNQAELKKGAGVQ